jgi:hypothetical protein
MQRRDVLNHVRRLRALIDRQPPFAGIPIGNHRTRLQCHPGMPAEHKLGFNHLVRSGKGLIDRPSIKIALESEVVTERRMDDWSFRIERGPHVRYRLEFLIFDKNPFRRILCSCTACCDNRGYGFALPARPVDGDRALRRRLQSLQVRKHADPGRYDRGKLFPGDDGYDAGRRLRRSGVDCHDPCMRMRRANEHHVAHPRQFEVADIETSALQQTIKIWPRHSLSDIGVRPVQY